MGSNASRLYVLGTSSYGYSVESFSWTGSVGSSPFINRFDSGLGTPYDIDISGSLIWVACDGADSPVKAYNTSGVLVNMIPGSVVENAARGMAFESESILWVSNPDTDKLYKIDLSLGISEEGGWVEPAVDLRASSNPFSSSVTISGTGFGDGAMLEIFDMTGRMVVESPFDGSYTWNGADVPCGAYVVRVGNGEALESINLVRF